MKIKNKVPSIAVIGTGIDSGKTTVTSFIIKTLSNYFKKINACKLAGTASQKDLYSYLFLLFLGGTQGLIGWWMVKSGLDLNPYVSHFRLAVHLLIAQIILSFIIFLFLKR